ncbi:DegT/DnrJ/EryC1/StrS family aminotransferase [Helicobacter mesocricetorum]|uniref:DegT/DnrJ/EryC1/StrS family aminotransferase n=1 Tax=Helicobacter mesocricetorum TaxID=87012 RepID=UPI000CF0A23B|nr:DegT/DnrJ/EryC1/StrS family aminotransferase [Helicobacter mesocricetorum]
MKIDFANLAYAHKEYQKEIESAMLSIARSANYIMGEEISKLEEELVEFIGGGYAITCGSGSDALLLALLALGIKQGDEVITTPFSFIATAEMIALLGAKPVFVDITLEDYNLDTCLIQSKITPKTKAILAVSLYGQPPNLQTLEQIARKNGIFLVIDGAQSFGAEFLGKKDSLYGDIATTSFFPAKPLGCYGDGGAVFTKDKALASKIASLRIHGQKERYIHEYIGIGGRLDTLQAAILRVKLRDFKEVIQKRNFVALQYAKYLKQDSLVLPKVLQDRTSTFAQYTIRVKNRAKLLLELQSLGIPSAIHYPLGLHLQECFKELGYQKGDFVACERASEEVLSLPMNPYLTEEQVQWIAQNINQRI